MKDLVNGVGLAATLAPAVVAASADGTAVDRRGFDSATVLIVSGAIVSAGDFTVKLQESDTTETGDFDDVVAADLIGAFPASLAAASVYKVGYKGTKRYLRGVITKNSGTSVAASVAILLGHASQEPVA